MPFQPEKNFTPESEENSEAEALSKLSVEELLERNLQDMDVLDEIFERANEEQIEKLRERTELSEREIGLGKHYAELRKEVHEDMEENLSKRKEENPEASEEELELGAYKEAIEPQMRDPVFTLRDKGYNTLSSGFGGPGVQQLVFEKNDYLEKFDQKKLKREMAEKGVELELGPGQINFLCQEKMPVEDLKEVWDTIAERLPEIDKGTKKSKISAAKRFRRRQERFEK